MKRSTFLATIAGLFSFLGFKKKPTEWNYGHVSTELEPLKWVDRGTVEFGPEIPVTPYVKTSVFKINQSDKVECSYISDDKFMVVELDTKTGEKKVLRMYNTKDMRA